MNNIMLITDLDHKDLSQEQEVCDACGMILKTAICKNEDDLIREGKDAFGFLCSYSKVTRKVMEALPNLKIVVKYGIGIDAFDVEAATDNGIVISNVPDYCMEEVASQTMMFILNGLKQTLYFHHRMIDKIWPGEHTKHVWYRLSELTLGLVSYGRIARKVVEYAKPFFKEIVFYDPYVNEKEINGVKKLDSLEELFATCKVISIHTPLNKHTEWMIGSNEIEKANGAILVNTSRNNVVEPKAVEKGLDDGSLVFFAGDSFWPEPADFTDKWTCDFIKRDDVLITPHMAWASIPGEKENRRKAAQSVGDLFIGKRPISVINPKVLEN